MNVNTLFYTTHYSKLKKTQPKWSKWKHVWLLFEKKKKYSCKRWTITRAKWGIKREMGKHWASSCSPSLKLFLLSRRRPHLQCPAQSLHRSFPFILFWQPQTAGQINPAVTHLNTPPPHPQENTVKGLLLGCRGALGCCRAICRRPRSRSPAAACSSTSRSRWPSGTACRGSRRGHSSLRETRAVRGQAFLFRWGVACS